MPKVHKLRAGRLPTRLRNQAEECRLFRWEEDGAFDGSFNIYGPYTATRNLELMTKALTRRERWLISVTSFFLTEEGDYYEEFLCADATAPVVLDDHMHWVLDVVNEMIENAKQGGNIEEYKDTVAAIYLYTPELEAKFKDTEWIQSQAEHHAKTVAKHHT